MLAAAGVGSTALFAGGHDGSVDSAIIDIYDGATDTWSTAKLSELRTGAVATTVGTKVLIAGGCLNDSCSRLSKVVDIYDTATGDWTTAALSEGRDNLAATRIGSTVFLAYGPGAVVEIYDDSTGDVEHRPALAGARRTGCHQCRLQGVSSPGGRSASIAPTVAA